MRLAALAALLVVLAVLCFPGSECRTSQDCDFGCICIDEVCEYE